jgi:putative phosphoribosyl transferase
MIFRDRVEAGERLGARLREYVRNEFAGEPLLVLALPRGGVPVGFEVARALDAPLDVLVVRKLGAPGHEELAMGAIAAGGAAVVNDEVVKALRVTQAQMDAIAAREFEELRRREQAYRGGEAARNVRATTVVLVDDGLATGYTMRAAVAALRQESPKRVVVAAPVAARSTCEELEQEADAVLCLFMPFDFVAVGQWYRNFAQTSDDEVRRLLHQTADRAERNAA